MKKYQFITIRQIGTETFEEKPVYRIFNNKTNLQLGIISWYKPWRQYVFSSRDDCVFNASCLGNVLDFLSGTKGA